ncbi:MAG: branched-chain amino acid transaminase [Thermoproteota archaeon]|jgi:branched chain amino acid aminotransferase (EC 2.6.1.42)
MKELKKLWIDGQFVDWHEAKIHILTHALHYGYAVFEGIRCFSTEEGPAIFRLRDHLERFFNSAKIYNMKINYTMEDLTKVIIKLIELNDVEECYIRPIAFTGYGEMGLNPLKNKVSIAVTLWEWGPYLGEEGKRKGVRCMVSSWIRVDSRSLPPQAKCAANYANSGLAKMEAVLNGYDEAIMLNSHGFVSEGPGENIFRVKEGVLTTPPASAGILRGVTRDTVIKFAKDLGITFYRNDISREELYTSDELFFTGTAAGIVPIREVDGRPIGNGDYPLTRKLQQLYEDTVHGRIEKYKYWLTYIKEVKTSL